MFGIERHQRPRDRGVVAPWRVTLQFQQRFGIGRPRWPKLMEYEPHRRQGDSDAQTEHHDGGEGEARRSAEHACAVGKILPKPIEPVPAPYLARVFPQTQFTAYRAARHLAMEGHFFCHLAFQALPAQQVPEPSEPFHDRPPLMPSSVPPGSPGSRSRTPLPPPPGAFAPRPSAGKIAPGVWYRRGPNRP
jgi:hypothetical protein